MVNGYAAWPKSRTTQDSDNSGMRVEVMPTSQPHRPAKVIAEGERYLTRGEEEGGSEYHCGHEIS